MSMIRSRRLATLTAVGALALAALTVAPAAHADPTIITPADPGTTVSLPLARPDLKVEFENIACFKTLEAGVRITAKVRVINLGPVATQADAKTTIWLDGVEIPGSPHVTAAPLWTTQVFHLNLPGAPGLRVLTAYTDSTFQVAESNENNNTAMARVTCPAG